MGNWYYFRNQEAIGPAPAEDIVRLFMEGTLGSDDFVQGPGMSHWTPLSKALDAMLEEVSRSNPVLAQEASQVCRFAAAPNEDMFWGRAKAFLVDVGIISVVAIAGHYTFIITFTRLHALQGFAILALVWWIYHARLESSSMQATWGKRLFGLYVTDIQERRLSFGHATQRCLALLLTPLSALFSFRNVKEAHTFHDRVTGCLVQSGAPIASPSAWMPGVETRALPGDTAVSKQQEAPGVASDSKYAGFWLRFTAYYIDLSLYLAGGIVLGWGLLYAPLWVPAQLGVESSTGAPSIMNVYGQFLFMIFSVGDWLYFAFFESSKMQATPGKWLLRLHVTGIYGERISFWRATGRFVATVLSYATAGIGFVMAGLTTRKQALHDMPAGCLVVRTAPSVENESTDGGKGLQREELIDAFPPHGVPRGAQTENSSALSESPAGFGRRSAAFVIDLFALIAVFVVVAAGSLDLILPIARFLGLPDVEPDQGLSWLIILGAISGALVTWLYFALLEASFMEGSLGKHLLGLRVVDLCGRSISFEKASIRVLAKALSGIILFIGLIMAAFTERRQTLHDIIAGSLVVRDTEVGLSS